MIKLTVAVGDEAIVETPNGKIRISTADFRSATFIEFETDSGNKATVTLVESHIIQDLPGVDRD
ncbi:MAG: hypothetical protein A2V88_09310 [Elusimicrobia bacterium RBG_16_66_12]|nr:MAG: hypothetical protein A2V88_09310 [Elusimicrobia bacterium RBG_16_66_12]